MAGDRYDTVFGDRCNCFSITENTGQSIEQQVAEDIAARSRKGVLKYGFTVAENPLPLRAWLQHAYEGSLDLPIYLKRAIVEMEQNESLRRSAETTLRNDWSDPCGCIRCYRASTAACGGGLPFEMRRMIVCPLCGNKRCPHASNHEFACTGSNEPNQAGSIF